MVSDENRERVEERVRLSVIIPCFNAARTLGTQLEALSRQTWAEPWEVIVADNGSTDDSLVVVEQFKGRIPSLRVEDASDGPGQPHALNVGARAARGECLAFCDADDEIAPGWLSAMGQALADHDFVACRFETYKLGTFWAREMGWNPQGEGIQEYDYPPFLPHAGGGSLGVKRALHEAIGGFDISLPALHDTDYCWRIQLAGTPLHFVPDAVVHVRSRSSLWGLALQARLWGRYNVILYKRYRVRGMPRITWKEGVLAWARLLLGILRIRSRPVWAQWLWEFAWRVGRLQASIEQGVFAL